MLGRVALFLVFLLAYFLSYFFRSTNAVIAEDLTRDLGLTAQQLGFMTSLFFVAFAAAQLPLGSALDRFGARFTTPVLMLSGVLGSILFAAASSFTVLALGRALIGLGMAGVLMGSFKAFSVAFSARRFAAVSGMFVGLGSLGALAAATPLAWLNTQIGWRNVFWLGAGVILASTVMIMLFGRVARADSQRAAPRRGSPPAENARDAGARAIFTNLTFWRIAAINFAVAGSMFAYQGLWAGPYLSDALLIGELEVGNLLLAMGVGVTIGYFVGGWLADRIGVPTTLALGAGVIGLVQLLLAFFHPGWPRSALGILFACFGFFGSFNVLSFAHVRMVFPLNMTGRAVTALNIFGIGGSALLQWGLGILIGLFPLTVASRHPAAAYRTAFLLTAGLCALALLFYLPLIRQARPLVEDDQRPA